MNVIILTPSSEAVKLLIAINNMYECSTDQEHVERCYICTR